MHFYALVGIPRKSLRTERQCSASVHHSQPIPLKSHGKLHTGKKVLSGYVWQAASSSHIRILDWVGGYVTNDILPPLTTDLYQTHDLVFHQLEWVIEPSLPTTCD